MTAGSSFCYALSPRRKEKEEEEVSPPTGNKMLSVRLETRHGDRSRRGVTALISPSQILPNFLGSQGGGFRCVRTRDLKSDREKDGQMVLLEIDR